MASLLRNRSAVMHIYHSVNRDLFEKSTMRLCEYAVTTPSIPPSPAPTAGGRSEGGDPLHQCQIFGMCIDWISGGMQDEALEERAAYQPPVPRPAGAHHRAQPGRPLKNLGKYPLTA